MDEHPLVFAVVLNYCGFEDSVKCIESLRRATYPNLAIVIVDNASPDQSGIRLASAYPEIPMVLAAHNTGYAGGNNAGMRFALEHGANYVLVLNNDVIVEPGFLEPMVRLSEGSPKVGITTCLVYYQGPRKEVFSAAGKLSYLLCTGINKGSHFASLRVTDRECYPDFACGVLLLIRRSVLEVVGMFDERYFMYFEDVEFSRRVLTRFKIAFTPSAIAYHKSGGGTTVRAYTELYLYYSTRNRIWVFHEDPVGYRAYVILYSVFNVFLKTIIVLTNILGERKRMVGQLRALWSGLRDGIFDQ